VSVVVVSSVELSPHAAKAPIANTKRSFFIVPVFVFNDLFRVNTSHSKR
jgi:hypothetical protein